jgi:hypothetical protein
MIDPEGRVHRAVQQMVGTIVFAENNAAEQTVLTIPVAIRAEIGSLWFDFVNVTQNVTIRIKHQVDGANYRTFEVEAWVIANDDGIEIRGFTAYRNVQVSFQCGGGGGGNVNIPYAIV